MKTSLDHLPEYKQRQLKEITDIIVKAVDPDKVILFGSHETGRWVEHRHGGRHHPIINGPLTVDITKDAINQL
jgi:hypothetical protein